MDNWLFILIFTHKGLFGLVIDKLQVKNIFFVELIKKIGSLKILWVCVRVDLVIYELRQQFYNTLVNHTLR